MQQIQQQRLVNEERRRKLAFAGIILIGMVALQLAAPMIAVNSTPIPAARILSNGPCQTESVMLVVCGLLFEVPFALIGCSVVVLYTGYQTGCTN